jgi:hypothetical protein
MQNNQYSYFQHLHPNETAFTPLKKKEKPCVASSLTEVLNPISFSCFLKAFLTSSYSLQSVWLSFHNPADCHFHQSFPQRNQHSISSSVNLRPNRGSVRYNPFGYILVILQSKPLHAVVADNSFNLQSPYVLGTSSRVHRRAYADYGTMERRQCHAKGNFFSCLVTLLLLFQTPLLLSTNT